MKIATAWSTNPHSGDAINLACKKIKFDLQAPPSLLIAYPSVNYPELEMLSGLTKYFPGVPIHGGTSSQGVMTEDGFHSLDGTGLGLLGIYDPKGSYGVGAAEIGTDARNAGARAIHDAIKQSGRVGEPPDLVWITSCPGYEEDVLLGIQDVIGNNTPIAGGSSADNTVEGLWYQFNNTDTFKKAVIVTAMYPSVRTHLTFQNGYSPTKYKGRVTKSKKRILYEIDGLPAAKVYNSWTGGKIEKMLNGGNILLETSLYPLGRVVDQMRGIPYYQLSHPESVTNEMALTLFSEIPNGEEIVLMQGTKTSLVSRAGRTAHSALDIKKLSPDDISGALVVYCAGCMLTVSDHMDDVAAEVYEALGGKPFLGTFTFGEQGCFLGGENRHGNLMISVVVFGNQ